MLILKHSTKALSPVVASIILIAVTVAVSIAVAAWMGALTVGFMGSSSITITNTTFDGTSGAADNTITLALKNTGTKSVTIAQAKVNNNAKSFNATTIAAGEEAGLLISAVGWSTGNPYKIDLYDTIGQAVGSTQQNAINVPSPTTAPTSTPTPTPAPSPTPTPTPTPTPQVTFVSAGTGSGTTGNPTPSYPTSLQAGDLILLQVTVRNTYSTPSTPSGFTLLYGPDSTGTGRQWIYYKFSTGTESGTITISISGYTNKMARMYAFRNVASSSFNEGGQFGSGTSSTISAQPVTTTGDGRLAVSFVFVNDNNAVDSFIGESGGDWQEATNEFTSSAGSDGCIQLQTATMVSAGTISGGSYVMSGYDSWGVRSFALSP